MTRLIEFKMKEETSTHFFFDITLERTFLFFKKTETIECLMRKTPISTPLAVRTLEPLYCINVYMENVVRALISRYQEK